MATFNALGLSGGGLAKINADDTLFIPGNLQVQGETVSLISSDLVVEDKTLKVGIPGGIKNATYTYANTGTVVTVASTAHGFVTNDYVMIIDPADPNVITEGTYQVTKVDNDSFTFVFNAGGSDISEATPIQHSVDDATATTANGSGIVVATASTTDISFLYDNASSAWLSSEHLNLANGKEFKINGTAVLTSSEVLGITNTDIVTLTGTQTLTNKTLTNPKIGIIVDSSGNEIVQFANPPSAVNYVKIEGNATGNAALITTEGDDTNVDLELAAKGTGIVKYKGAEIGASSDGTEFDTGLVVKAGETVDVGSIVYADSSGLLVVATDNSHKYVLLSASADDRNGSGNGTTKIRAYKPGIVHNISDSGLSVGEVFLAADGTLSNTAPTTGSEVLSIGHLLKDDNVNGDLLLFNPVHKYSL